MRQQGMEQLPAYAKMPDAPAQRWIVWITSLGADGMDLVKRMLVYDPLKRISAYDVRLPLSSPCIPADMKRHAPGPSPPLLYDRPPAHRSCPPAQALCRAPPTARRARRAAGQARGWIEWAQAEGGCAGGWGGAGAECREAAVLRRGVGVPHAIGLGRAVPRPASPCRPAACLSIGRAPRPIHVSRKISTVLRWHQLFYGNNSSAKGRGLASCAGGANAIRRCRRRRRPARRDIQCSARHVVSCAPCLPRSSRPCRSMACRRRTRSRIQAELAKEVIGQQGAVFGPVQFKRRSNGCWKFPTGERRAGTKKCWRGGSGWPGKEASPAIAINRRAHQ